MNNERINLIHILAREMRDRFIDSQDIDGAYLWMQDQQKRYALTDREAFRIILLSNIEEKKAAPVDLSECPWDIKGAIPWLGEKSEPNLVIFDEAHIDDSVKKSAKGKPGNKKRAKYKRPIRVEKTQDEPVDVKPVPAKVYEKPKAAAPVTPSKACLNDARKALGKAPYNQGTNYLVGDGYFSLDCKRKYGERMWDVACLLVAKE